MSIHICKQCLDIFRMIFEMACYSRCFVIFYLSMLSFLDMYFAIKRDKKSPQDFSKNLTESSRLNVIERQRDINHRSGVNDFEEINNNSSRSAR